MISIALATYNGQRYLREQLDCYAAQTLLPDEIVAVDDCSTDGTVRVLEQFAKTAPFTVRIVRNEHNLGFGQNFAKALRLAAGDLIFLSDQDDIWLPTKLAHMKAAFDSPEVMVATCDQSIMNSDGEPIGDSVLTQLRSVGVHSGLWSVGCCTAITASFRELMLPLPSGVSIHDAWIEVLARSLEVHRTVPEVLQYHRRHDGNLSPDVLNSFAQTSRLARLRWYFAITPDHLANFYPYYEGVVDRLSPASPATSGSAERDRLGLARAERRLSALRARHAIARRPRWRRLPAVVDLAKAGGYGQFNGWKSIAKDLLSTRISS